VVGLPALRAPQHRLHRAHLRDQFEDSRNHRRRPQPCRRFALLDHPRASTTRLSRFVKILTPTASACCARAAASIRRKAFIGHRLDSRQRESCISQLQTRESDLLRCPRGQEKCATCAQFSIFPQRARKSWTGWRREVDSNPRTPSGFQGQNSTRVGRNSRPEQKPAVLERVCSPSTRPLFGPLQVLRSLGACAEFGEVKIPKTRSPASKPTYDHSVPRFQGRDALIRSVPYAEGPRTASRSEAGTGS